MFYRYYSLGVASFLYAYWRQRLNVVYTGAEFTGLVNDGLEFAPSNWLCYDTIIVCCS